MFKAILGADIGDDNNIFDLGEHSTFEDALKAIETLEYKIHAYYGAEIQYPDGRVSISNGYWGDNNSNWHSPINN